MTTRAAARVEAVEPQHPLADDLSFLLGRAWLGFGELRSEALAPFGINVRQFAVLKAIAATSGSQIEVANLAKIDKSTFAIAVDSLEERGLIQRATDPRDRRVKRLTVTEAAQRLLPAATIAVERAEKALLAGIDRRELEISLSVLQRLAMNDFADGPAFNPRRFHA